MEDVAENETLRGLAYDISNPNDCRTAFIHAFQSHLQTHTERGFAGFAVVSWDNEMVVSVSYAALEPAVLPDMVRDVLKRQIGADMVQRVSKR